MTTRPDPAPDPNAPRPPTDRTAANEEEGPNQPILPMPGGDPNEKADAPWDLTRDADPDDEDSSKATET